MCISTGNNNKSAITIIFGSKIFCKIQRQKKNVREYVSADFQRQKHFTLAENSKKADFIPTLCLSAV